MHIQLSDHFTYKKLLRFTLPSIAMMIFSSVYGVIDGFFVSNFTSKTSFAAVNLIMPFLMIFGSFGFMFGTGGSALVAKTLGEGEKEKANKLFSLIVYVTMACGAILSGVGIAFIRPVARLFGAEGQMLADCVLYGRIILAALPAFMLQYEFQAFFSLAEKPKLGFYVTLAAGLTNIVLDGLFVGVFQWKIVGAAAATVISQAVGGVYPLVYFSRKNSSLLRLERTVWQGKALRRVCSNGFSELLSNVAFSFVSILYNAKLMALEGENGVAAYGVLMYVSMIFSAVFIGYCVGTAPVVSYHYGAANHGELRSLRKKSLRIAALFSVSMFALSEGLALPLTHLFVGYDVALTALTLRAFRICSLYYLFFGVGIFGSSFFTALNNGKISAIISFFRTLVFQIAAIYLLPLLLNGIDGIWLSVVAAEVLAALLTVAFLVANRKKYHY